MPFSGQEVSEKGFPRGWDADAEDQASQRQFRIAQLLEAMTFRPFAWDRFNSLNLKYAYHGGYIDAGSEWVLIPDSVDTANGGTFIALQDGATNFIERTDAGVVVVNQSGFTYLDHIPMAQIDARNGSFVGTTYIDRRPEIGGAPSSISDTISFDQIIGQILAGQVPLEVVKQWESQLCISAANLLPGVFGQGLSCNPAQTGDYTFPRDLGVLQDLFVGRDAVITEDLAVLENMNVLGIFTAEGVAVFEALATFLAAVVMESTLNVEGAFTAESTALFQALATFQAAAVFESTVNVEGTFTAESLAIFQALATFQSLAVFEAAVTFESSVNVEGISTLENQVRRGIRTITAADTPYSLVATDWHLNVDISLGSVEVLVPDAAAHSSGGFTDQLHFKIIGSGFMEPFVTLTPSVPGQLIDGFEAAILRRNNLSFTLVSDATGWWIQ